MDFKRLFGVCRLSDCVRLIHRICEELTHRVAEVSRDDEISQRDSEGVWIAS